MNFKNKGAVWLWDDSDIAQNAYLCFRQEINIDSAEKAYIYLSCDTTYMLWVNGEFVNFGQYLGQPENKYFDKLDISEKLNCGKNTVCVLVYYQGHVSSSCYAPGCSGLIYYIACDGRIYANDNVLTAHASGFKEGELPRISYQLGSSFEYDARKAEDWTSPTFVPGENWKKAVKLDFSSQLAENIAPRPIKKLDFSQRTDFLLINKGEFVYTRPESNVAERMQSALMRVEGLFGQKKNESFVIDKDNTSVILDIGCETAGYFELEIDCDDELSIDVAYGEHLADMRVRSFVGGRNFAFTYHAKKGSNKFTNFMRRIAGRYLQLNFTGVTGSTVVKYVGLRKAEYPVKMKSPIPVTDRLHKKIYETSIKTLRECMHEHYEDCPWREQSLYGFDSRNQMLAGYSVFKNHEVARASLGLLDATLGDDGFQRICAPTSGTLKIPGFSLWWIVGVCEYVLNTGCVKDMEKFYPRIEKMFEIYSGMINEYGIIVLPTEENYWHFYDWVDGYDGSERQQHVKKTGAINTDSVFNLITCFALKKYISVLEMKNADTAKFKKMYRILKNGINKKFYNKENGLYKNFIDTEHYGELTQALAIVSDVSKNKRIGRKALSSGTLVKTSLSTTIIKYEALMEDESYYEYVMDDIAEVWGKMLYSGATTFYETEKGQEDFANAGSLCHGWSAIPIIVYDKYYR